MKIDSRAFTLAVGMVAAVGYLACAGLVALSPHGTMVLFATMMHADLGTISWSLSWAGVAAGLILTTGLLALAACLVSMTYNVLAEPGDAAIRHPRIRSLPD